MPLDDVDLFASELVSDLVDVICSYPKHQADRPLLEAGAGGPAEVSVSDERSTTVLFMLRYRLVRTRTRGHVGPDRIADR